MRYVSLHFLLLDSSRRVTTHPEGKPPTRCEYPTTDATGLPCRTPVAQLPNWIAGGSSMIHTTMPGKVLLGRANRPSQDGYQRLLLQFWLHNGCNRTTLPNSGCTNCPFGLQVEVQWYIQRFPEWFSLAEPTGQAKLDTNGYCFSFLSLWPWWRPES